MRAAGLICGGHPEPELGLCLAIDQRAARSQLSRPFVQLKRERPFAKVNSGRASNSNSIQYLHEVYLHTTLQKGRAASAHVHHFFQLVINRK